MESLSGLLTGRLPHHPYCSDQLGSTQIRCLSNAIKHRYIQPNDPVRRWLFVYDVDREGAAYAWDNIVAEPNFSVINRVNGHAHLFYCLDTPVYLLGKARIAPLKYATAVQAAYKKLLGADPSYQENLCKNPLHESWLVLNGPEWAYDLDELASFVPEKELRNAKRRKSTMQVGFGRNVSLFDAIRTWAYRCFNSTRWISFDAWHRAVEAQAQERNGQFPVPLAWSEVKAIAKSVSRWVWGNFDPSTFSEIQAARGRKSGAARRKGTALEHDRKPWLAEGVSRATWYRHRRHQKQKSQFDNDGCSSQ